MEIKKLKDALLKKALGYQAEETVEEFIGDGEGGERCAKRKVTVKEVPADLNAIKMILGELNEEKPLSGMSDEELKSLREKYLRELIKLKHPVTLRAPPF